MIFLQHNLRIQVGWWPPLLGLFLIFPFFTFNFFSSVCTAISINLHQNPLIEEQGSQWVDIIDHWSIIDHFANMVDVLEFVVDITLKWSIFHQNIPERRCYAFFCQNSEYFYEFLPKFLPKFYPKKRVITTFATKKARYHDICDKKSA